MDQFAKLSDLLFVSSDISSPEVSTDTRAQFADSMGAALSAARASLHDVLPTATGPSSAEEAGIFVEGGWTTGLVPPKASIPSSILVSSEVYPNIIQGLFSKDWLRAPIVFLRDFIADTTNLAARISGFLDVYEEDLPGLLFPVHERDLPASTFGYPPEDITAFISITSAPNLTAYLQTIPGKDLPAFAGAHPPEDITAHIAPYLPVNLTAFLHPVKSTVANLSASLQQIGGFKDLSFFSRAAYRETTDLKTKLIVRTPVNLTAYLHGFDVFDLPADIITQRIKDMRAIIRGWVRESEEQLRGIIRITFSQSENLPVEALKAVVSTNTSDNPFNLDRVQTSFFGNNFLFGTKRGGAFKFTLQPVFGDFPDLHGSIFAKILAISDFFAVIRATFPGTGDIGSSTVAVTPSININKIGLSLRPLKNLNASIIQRGGFIGLNTIVTGVVKASTYTSEDSGFSTSATSYKFLLGTSGGLVIPSKNVPTIIITSHFNNASLPDLNGTISGWVVSNLSAYIKEYEFLALPSSLNAIDISHISALSAHIAPFRETNLSASITQAGQFQSLASSINVSGGVSDLNTFIHPYINPLAYNVVPISTKPFQDLSAIINYESYVRCAVRSQALNLSAFVKVVSGNTEDTKVNLTAYLNALSLVLDLAAEVEPRKRTRIRTLTLNFRTGIRSSKGISAVVVPSRSTQSSLLTSIIGLSHTKDLASSINVVRYGIVDPPVTLSETVIKLDNPDYSSKIMVAFRSQVSSYVFEELSSKVYTTDKGTWALDMRTANTQSGFFDLATSNSVLKMEDITEYKTLDEAIRAGIVILTERRRYDIPASISAAGQIGDLKVAIGVTSSDLLKDLKSSVTTVENLPDLAAAINTGLQSSSFNVLGGLIKPENTKVSGDMGASIDGSIINDLPASLTVS